jgi:hypothetical protein
MVKWNLFVLAVVSVLSYAAYAHGDSFSPWEFTGRPPAALQYLSIGMALGLLAIKNSREIRRKKPGDR